VVPIVKAVYRPLSYPEWTEDDVVPIVKAVYRPLSYPEWTEDDVVPIIKAVYRLQTKEAESYLDGDSIFMVRKVSYGMVWGNSFICAESSYYSDRPFSRYSNSSGSCTGQEFQGQEKEKAVF
ncbi:MAG: hypothetical protein OXB86_03525, partial [Bdellovibrionales bacterium]|nr:hypothetical protein [Bdellovibrionales bacterium]